MSTLRLILKMLTDGRLISGAILLVAAIASCERSLPTTSTGSGGTLAQLVVLPSTVSVVENQSADFLAVGLTSAGDTIAVAVNWSAAGGSITDSTSSKGMHYGRYKAGGQAGTFKVVANDPVSGLSDSATALVTATAAPVAAVAVAPTTASSPVGGTVQFVAVPLDSTGTVLGGRVVVWSSSNTSVATVDNSGLATAAV